MSIRSDLNELIDWYEKHKPASGQEIVVVAAANTVRKFARRKRGGPYVYRSRIIIPTRGAKTKA